MFVKSRALVLHTFKYNDTASVSVLFTEERGLVTFLLRISKTRRSSGKYKLFQPLHLLQVEWEPRDSRSLQHIRNANILFPYTSIPYEPNKRTIAMFISEFLYHCLRGEQSGYPLFEYLYTSLQWLDSAQTAFSNFHLVFLMRLSRFLGFFPNLDNYTRNCHFDLLNSCFTPQKPLHPYQLEAAEAASIPLLLRMNYDTMHVFRFTRSERNRLLDILNEYYSLHIPDFPKLKSLEVLRQLYD